MAASSWGRRRLDTMSRRRPKPLAPAFSRKVRRASLLFAVLAICAFAWETHWIIDTYEKRSLAERARLCAASLVPGRNGDLSDSVARLLSQYDGLVAVATLNAAGDLEVVHPERPAHRRAAMAVLESSALRARVQSPLDGRPMDVTAAIVPLNGSQSFAARKALVMFRGDANGEIWKHALGCFAVSLAVGALYLTWSLGRWFDRRIAARLRYLARVTNELPSCPAETPTIERCEWSETTTIGERFQELVDQIATTNAHAHHLKREAEQEIRQREHGFDRELRRANDRATVDALTKVRNRTFFEDRLEPLFAQQRDSSRDFTAVMIDIDNFKQYNDLHGHQTGDLLLKFVGALLRGAVRPEDYAIRYGGDEFLLLLPDTDVEQAAAIAERLVRLFGQYTRSLRRKQNLSLSIGVASLITHNPETGYKLVLKADQALYLAKRQGKNRVATYPRARRIGIAPSQSESIPTTKRPQVEPPVAASGPSSTTACPSGR